MDAPRRSDADRADGPLGTANRRRRLDRGRALSVDAVEGSLPCPLSLTDQNHCRFLAAGGPRRLRSRPAPRALLPWLLLGIDGRSLCHRNHESGLGGASFRARAGGKAAAARASLRAICGAGVGGLGPGAGDRRIGRASYRVDTSWQIVLSLPPP